MAGLSGAPKFPNAPIFRFFWNEMFRRGDPSFGEALRAMLEAMNAGGIYDHLGGGYARYSTDAEWLVPHFEKMLYDNAQILELLALVHSLWPDPTFAERARETVGWLMREMRVGDAFAASLDADQDGEEGLFYVWDEDDVDAALGEAARPFKAAYDVTRGGNWEDRTVLRRITPRGSPEAEAELAKSRAKLFALREARAKPGRDDKVLADWNGLTIAALARASAAFSEPAWLKTARAAFDFIMTKLRGPDGRLLHAWREGHPGARALLDDYASMARAALALFEASGEPGDLEAARQLASKAIDLFGDGAGGFYLTASDAADVPGARPRQTHDGATPSGVGLLAEVFVRLWHLTDEARWGEAAEGLIRAVSGAPEGLGGSPLTLMSADMLARGGSVVIDGPLDDPGSQALAFAALRAPDPSLTVLRLDRQLMAERGAARRSAACRRADRDAVPGPDLQLAGVVSRRAGAPHEREDGLRLKSARREVSSLVACAKTASAHHLSHGHVLAAHDHRNLTDKAVVDRAIACMCSGGSATRANDVVFDHSDPALDMLGCARREGMVSALNRRGNRFRSPSAREADAVHGIDGIALEMRQFETSDHLIRAIP